MKKSFTMIELIFVIVILGILAAVAIPKLVATRDDAVVSKVAYSVKSALSETISYYIAKGGEVNFSNIDESSQVALVSLIQKGRAEVIDDNTSYIYSDKEKKVECIKCYTSDGLKIEVEFNDSNKDNICKGLKRVIEERNYTVLGGSVEY